MHGRQIHRQQHVDAVNQKQRPKDGQKTVCQGCGGRVCRGVQKQADHLIPKQPDRDHQRQCQAQNDGGPAAHKTADTFGIAGPQVVADQHVHGVRNTIEHHQAQEDQIVHHGKGGYPRHALSGHQQPVDQQHNQPHRELVDPLRNAIGERLRNFLPVFLLKLEVKLAFRLEKVTGQNRELQYLGQAGGDGGAT